MAATETNRRSKKKSGAKKRSRRNSKKISEEEHKAELEAAKERAVEEARKEWEEKQRREEAEGDFGYSDEEEEPQSAFPFMGPAYHETFGDEDVDANDAAQRAAFDLFDWVENKYVKKGIPVEYEVRRNGTIVGTVEPPFSWKQVQQEWGGGHYTVKAKEAVHKQYIKSQTQSVAGPVNKEEKEPEKIVQTPPPQSSADVNKMFEGMMGMFSQMQEMVNKERRQEERDERRSSESFNQTFLTLITESQKTSQEMFLKLQENTTKVMEKLGDNFHKALEKQDEKMNKMFERLADSQKNDEKFSTKDLIGMLQDSESKGMETMRTVLELSEERAERLSEKDNSGETKDGLIAQTLKGFLPLLAKANQATAQPYMGGMPTPQQQQQWQALPGAGRPQPQPRPNAAQQPSHPSQPGTGPVEKTPLGGPSISDILDDDTESQSHDAGLDQWPQEAAIKEGFIEPESEFHDDETDLDSIRPGVGEDAVNLYEEASITQRTICELAVPTIGAHLFASDLSPKEVAAKVSGELQSQGFTPEVVVKEFPLEVLFQVARSLCVGPEHDRWLEEFHAEIQSLAGNDVIGSGEHTESESTEAPTGLER